MAQKKTLPSLISSAGSGASASGLKQPDLFGQLPSVNKTPSAKSSSESTGPKSRSTTTLEPSTQMDIEELTSSAAAFHVNRGPQPGSSEAQKMTVTSGRSWLPLLKTYGLDGSLGKMCEALLTSRWACSAVFLTWKASDTKPSHLLFQLAPSMPRTDEIGSGLWPTPTGQDNAQVRGVGKTIGTNRGTTLGGAVRMWPTPTVQDSNKATKKWREDHQNNLTAAVFNPEKMFPTPTARDWKGGYTTKALMRKDGKSRATDSLENIAMGGLGAERYSGQLNPMWVEWLMGFPTAWTELKPSETPSSRKSSRKSAKQSSQQRARDVSK